jgi:hypothetical protein
MTPILALNPTRLVHYYPCESRGLVRLFATHDSPCHEESRGLAPRILRFLAGTPDWSEKPKDPRYKPAGFRCASRFVVRSRKIRRTSLRDLESWCCVV